MAGIYLLPVLAAIVAIVGVFLDRDTPAKRRCAAIVVFVILIIAGLTIRDNVVRSEDDSAYRTWSRRTIADLASTVAAFRDSVFVRFNSLDAELLSFGWTPERVRQSTVADVERSLTAAQAREVLLVSIPPLTRKRSTVEYWPKDVDAAKVRASLSELGFSMRSGPSVATDAPTNAIWFGKDVAIEDVKLVALTLTRAGVNIVAIRPFARQFESRRELIQVGSDRLLLGAAPLAVESVVNAREFSRE